MNNVRYLYLRDTSGNPHSVIAMHVDREAKALSFQISTANKSERFDKEIGRDLAYGRLLADSHVITIEHANANAHELNSYVMNCIITCSSLFAVKAVKSAVRWLEDHDARPTLKLRAYPERVAELALNS